VHYEALDVYEQHFSTILGVTQIPNPVYAIAIAIAFQAGLQAIIAQHRTMPNNPDLVLISVNLSLQQLIVVIANILTTIDAVAFADRMGELFQVLEL
jgi:hypothetical protein